MSLPKGVNLSSSIDPLRYPVEFFGIREMNTTAYKNKILEEDFLPNVEKDIYGLVKKLK